MGGVEKSPEHLVRCLPSLTKSGGDEQLRLQIGGIQIGVKLCISHLSRQLVSDLPERAIDLLELAALVYGIDAAISRGGPMDQQFGEKWHRRFCVEAPVRDFSFWEDAAVKDTLEETLMFLSGDRFSFQFTPKTDAEAEQSRFFKFDDASSWKATRVLMFSGGLDSFAGALEEIAEHGQKVALVSHFSASKIAPVQRHLQKALADKFGVECCKHIPVQVQMAGGALKEGTHRSRSFLFAVLGAITAQAFGLDRVSFYENGVVSLNLPPVGNVLGTRATRTTHPQTLTRFTDLFGQVFDSGVRVDNPFFWRTKKDVVATVARLNMQNEIAQTRSCADVHNQTKQHPHCGRCSQCIDRRFAILAAGLERFDPEEAYRVALMDDARTGAIDREIALSYLRNAQAYEHMNSTDLERCFPAVLNAVGHLEQPATATLEMIGQLLNRHGHGVVGVMRETLKKQGVASFASGSLPSLYGEVQRELSLPAVEHRPSEGEPSKPQPVVLAFDEKRRRVWLDSNIELTRNATADLLIVLAKLWLEGAGKGLEPLDFPCIEARILADQLDLESDEGVRQRVSRSRTTLMQKFASCGLDKEQGKALIENVAWHGYRLLPEQVIVRVLA